MPIFQSQPSGFTAGSIARPIRPRMLCRFHSPDSRFNSSLFSSNSFFS